MCLACAAHAVSTRWLLRPFAPPAACLPLPQKYWDMRNQRPYRHVSVLMIENAFKKTELWQGVESQLAQPFDASSADPRALATTK